VTRLATDGLLARTATVRAELFGSLGVTGHGYGTVKAVVLGLEGDQPDLADPTAAEPRVSAMRNDKVLRLGGKHAITFSMDEDLVLYARWVSCPVDTKCVDGPAPCAEPLRLRTTPRTR
jgi:L-serine dehydratase